MRRHHGRAPSPYAGRVPTPPSAEVTLVRSFDHQINPSRPARQSPLATSQIQGMPLDLIERIRAFPLFQSAPDSFLYEVGLVLKPQMYAPNDYLMTEGDVAKAMYWIVRGAVAVCSRDGESTYAELKAGSFVGEIGILMDRPRTATVIARTRCLSLQLKKEDLKRILPKFPEVERAVREEALERLAILEKKKRQAPGPVSSPTSERRGSKRTREEEEEEMQTDVSETNNKRRKSPSPGVGDVSPASALGFGLVNVRALLKELPLFANLPAEPLHFLGLNAQPRAFPPFVDIIKQNNTGREVYFIVHGEVEVIGEQETQNDRKRSLLLPPVVKARLRAGQYFGEVVSLDLAPRRTATVRSVTQVECLMIPEKVLAEFWNRCPPLLRAQIEQTALSRLKTAFRDDVEMKDVYQPPSLIELELDDEKKLAKKLARPARVTFSDAEIAAPVQPLQSDDPTPAEPSDPDPFSSIGLENVRSRSRRGSLAPPPPDEPVPKPSTKPRRSPRPSPKSSPRSSQPSSPSAQSSAVATPSPLAEGSGGQYFPFSNPFAGAKRPQITMRLTDGENRGSIPDEVLVLVFQHFELHELMNLQVISLHWQNLLLKSDKLVTHLDLARYNRCLNDQVIVKQICPFVGTRPRTIDICNCFHVSDEGFSALADKCGQNVTCWKMKSVWDVTANAILEMSSKAKGLVSVDLSNCRKVSDTLLARVVGWVVPQHPPAQTALGRHSSMRGRPMIRTNKLNGNNVNGNTPPMPPPGTVIGCPNLSHLTLSYCKHVTDRTMHHLAMHAASRLEFLDLTRCTTITDVGFGYWGQNSSNIKFTKLRKLILADCTYLSDQAIIYLTTAAGAALRYLDLSFCCALSDTSTEVIALGCSNLESLDMSFCGSAISDASLRSIGNHLTNMQHLAVRGCVRVTGIGVDGVVDGCKVLETFDVSQCKNLMPWVAHGGIEKWRARGRGVKFLMSK
ncbi:hypothetical protein LTR05_001822 [Lithohypha guttulata]|uniref:Cyclic nucleotide-binding domain-containing protein n=1 Tax=Lithohypha guttulata TaxID=1690604 RepID=A0AAN7YFK8_9EURO|nr:hypothetical protein LTR05_001822 [Lithohypha guttulata]